MAHIGCTLLGDWLYGVETPLIARPALHSHRLDLLHPVTGERLQIAAPLPDDMRRVIETEEMEHADMVSDLPL
ncbi:MAG: hypothetical protein IKR84_03490 [Oscillibacter sp.]|nr:hypothetical protein [Oscillibacter sp.]